MQAQAGARKVYAVEASGMANFARQLAEGNKGFGNAVQVCVGHHDDTNHGQLQFIP